MDLQGNRGHPMKEQPLSRRHSRLDGESRGTACQTSALDPRFHGEDERDFRRLKVPGLGFVIILVGLFGLSCSQTPNTGEDAEVTTRGSVEVTAELVEIRGEFVDRADYDYAFVMQYKITVVHRGDIEGDLLYIAHYNPQKPRDRVADARVTDVGGELKKFSAGDVHRMALEVPIDDYYMGGIINRYFEDYSGPIYWAVWTNPVSK